MPSRCRGCLVESEQLVGFEARNRAAVDLRGVGVAEGHQHCRGVSGFADLELFVHADRVEPFEWHGLDSELSGRHYGHAQRSRSRLTLERAAEVSPSSDRRSWL